MRPSDTSQEARLSELMRLGQDGDESSYKKLLTEIARILSAFVRNRLGSADCCEEVVQEILLSIHQARHSYDPSKPFKPWMFAIARYRLSDYFRRWARTKRKEIANDEDLNLENVEWLSYSPFEPDSEMSVKLSEAMAELPPRQREAVELLKFQGLSIKEAAKKLGLSEGAVKVTAHRAYRALRERIGVENYENA